MNLYVVVPRRACQKARVALEDQGWLNSDLAFVPMSSSTIALPIQVETFVQADQDQHEWRLNLKRFLERKLEGLLLNEDLSFWESSDTDRAPTRGKPTPQAECRSQCREVMMSLSLWQDQLESEMPSHWEQHGDLILLPDTCFSHQVWWDEAVGSVIWETVLQTLDKASGARRLAKKSRIADDQFRSPQVRMLYAKEGSDIADTWVTHVDNGVKYTWDIARCMFSIGNITEKLRIAQFDCREETVVDLFAGIGYFTLPYLVHAKAAMVHACEWNPASVEALRRNLQLNNVNPDRYHIHPGDNREKCPRNVADRVNLGLIPSSAMAWTTACLALKPETGGILHIHANVELDKYVKETPSNDQMVGLDPDWHCKRQECANWALETATSILGILRSHRHSQPDWKVTMLKLVKVKSYAPKVDHVVLDLRCTPIND